MLRKLLMILAVLLCAVPALAEESLMEDHAVRLAQELPSIIDNEAFTELYTGGFDEECEALIAQYSGYAWSKPMFDVYLSCDMSALKAYAGAQWEALTEDDERYMRQFTPTMIYVMLTNTVNQAEVVAGSVMQNALYYADPAQPDGTVMFIRFFEDGSPLLYVRSAREGAVLLTAQVLSMEGLVECRSIPEVQALLNMATEGVILGTEEPVQLPYAGTCVGEGTMAERAQALAQEMMKNLADKSYIVMLTDSEPVLSLLLEWADDDYSQPRLMACAELDAMALGTSVWGMDTAVIFAQENSPAARNLRYRLAGSVTMRLSSVFGVNAIVAHSVSGHSTMYADPEQPEGMGLYILLYEDGNAIAVSYLAENGAVVLSASCLPDEAVSTCLSAADISLYMLKNDLPMVFNEIEIEEQEMNE